MPKSAILLVAWMLVAFAGGQSSRAQEEKPAFPNIDAAIKALAEDEFEIRQRASDFLWKSGKAAQPALELAITSSDAEVRLRSMMVLRKVRLGITPDTPPELHALITQFYDGDRNVRQRVISELRQKQAFNTLFALLQTETDPTSRQLFYSTLQADIQRLAPQMIASKDWSMLEQWLDVGKGTEAGRAPFVAYTVLRDRLPNELKKAQADYEKNKADPMTALLYAALLRASGDKTQGLEIAASVKAPTNTWLQGAAREEHDWLRVAELQSAKAANPRAELFRLATRGTAFRLANKPAEANAEFQQLKTQAPNDDVWFAAKVFLLNDRPADALELLQPGLRPMAFDLLVQRQEHQAALDLVGIKDDTKFDAAWLGALTGQQSVRTSRTVDRFAFAVTIAAELRTLGKQKQFEELHTLLQTTAAAEDSRGLNWQQLARLERQPGRQRQLLETYARGATTNYQSALSALFRTRFARAQAWWEALDGDARWQAPAARLTVVAVAMQPATYAKHAEVDWPAVSKFVAAKADNEMLPGPTRAKYHVALAEAWTAREDKTQADVHWQAACAADVSAREAYADALLAEKRWLEAAAQYQKVTDANQGNTVAWYLQGLALRRAGQEDVGLSLQSTANLMCLDSRSRYSLAYALHDRNLREEAQEQWLLLQRIGHPDDSTVTLASQYLGNFVAKENPLGACEYWEQLRFHLLKPTTNLVDQAGYLDLGVSIHQTRARGLLAKGDKQGALALLKVCNDLIPGSIKVVEEFHPLLRKAGMDAEADQLFENSFKIYSESAKQYPDSASQHNNAAWVAALCGQRLDEALALAERAVKLAPESPSYADTMAEVHFARGDREQALTWARKSVELEPDTKLYQDRLQAFATRELPKK
jgi:tetratricopeptide (TPR) repeat protein